MNWHPKTLATTMLAILIAAAGPAVASQHDVLIYHADETSGRSSGYALDSSGYANNGYRNGIGSAPGLSGQAYRFDGTGAADFVKVPASHSLNPGTKRFSYSTAINIHRTTDITHDYSLFRRGSAKFSGVFYKMELVVKKVSGNVRLECAFRDQSGSTGYVAVPGTWNDGTWHTLRCAKTATKVSLTVDGTTYSKPAALGSFSTDEPLYLGVERVEKGFWEQFQGRMDEIVMTKG